MNAAELMARCLENEGVRHVFGVPGEENLDLLEALHASSIPFITTRHEQGAAFMANVWGRLTGEAGVCLSTLGPGATNLITGVADAQVDRAPLVAITGQVGLERMHKESHQYLDLVQIFAPVTKWNTQIKRASTVPEAVRKAFKVAQMEKPGATHLDFPEDVAQEQAQGAPLRRQQPYPPEATEAQIQRAVRILSEAKAPIVLAGNGVTRGRASEALRRFARKLNIPVAQTFMGKGVISSSDPRSLLTVGLQARDYISCGFERADVVVAVGYDLVEYAPASWNPDRDKVIIHIDRSPAEVDASYIVAVGVVGDLVLALDALADRVPPREDHPILALHETLIEELQDLKDDPSFPLKPQRIVHTLRDVLDSEDLVISDVGAHKIWLARMYPCEAPNTCLISNGFAAMGIGLPGAIAAKLCHPERRVVAAVGDGGFLMAVQELETAVRLQTPLVVLIFNDGGYGLIGWKQQTAYGREHDVAFGNPDFAALARAFGCEGFRIQAAGELHPALKEALTRPRPVVIDCPVDYSENLKLTEKLGRLVCPI